MLDRPVADAESSVEVLDDLPVAVVAAEQRDEQHQAEHERAERP